MEDHEKSKEQLVQEIAELRRSCATFEITASERKQLETEIQDAREYAENIVETVRKPLVVLDSDLKILTANHSFYDTFKVAPEETIGKFIYDLGNRQWDIPKLRVLFEDILPNETVFNDYEVEHDFLDIGRKIILLNAREIFRENIGSHIILLAMEDITERKQLETQIQDAREYAENIVETMREPLVVLNSDLKILTANHSFYDTFKVAPEETIGNFIYDLGNRQWDIPKLRVLFEEILPHDTVFNGYEVEHDFLDIGRKIILLNARQIFRENIGSHIILLAMEDITERKLTEQKLLDKNTELERFTYTVSHDLKSPLITIQSYAGMIEHDLEAGNHARAQTDLKRIECAASKMTFLLNDLLDLSHVGMTMNEPSPIDMNLLLTDCLAQLAGPLRQKRIEVVQQSDLPSILGDSQRLSAVLQNLIENSVKYMGDQAAPRIEIGTREDGKVTVFFVSDNGAGIDRLNHETIFGLFNKLNVKSPGTGVGLALVKRIIEVHAGKVWVESEGAGKGSTFCFTLPGAGITKQKSLPLRQVG